MAEPSFKGTRSARIAVGLAIASAILAAAAGLMIYLALAFQPD